MQILLTNDDGVYSPGLLALERELRRFGDVTVVAPAVEQSGVGHSVTFLSPLVAKEVYEDGVRRAWAVEGSPADCVKLGLFEFCPRKPDLVVSGLNAGLNAGINVLYSGTVAAAIEGAFYGITSVAVSLEDEPHADVDHAAAISRGIIESILDAKDANPQLFNLNLPAKALLESRPVHVVPMGLSRTGENFEKRFDPRGRPYFWATLDSPPEDDQEENDLIVLQRGDIALTPLHFDLTAHNRLKTMKKWNLDVEIESPAG